MDRGKKVMNMFSEMNQVDPNPRFDCASADAAGTLEKEAAVKVDELPVGTVLEVETTHHTYLLENCGSGKVLISGHPEYCPEPVLVDLHGATDNTNMIRMSMIERGMRMQFGHPTLGVIRTSRVREIRGRKTITRAA